MRINPMNTISFQAKIRPGIKPDKNNAKLNNSLYLGAEASTLVGNISILNNSSIQDSDSKLIPNELFLLTLPNSADTGIPANEPLALTGLVLTTIGNTGDYLFSPRRRNNQSEVYDPTNEPNAKDFVNLKDD